MKEIRYLNHHTNDNIEEFTTKQLLTDISAKLYSIRGMLRFFTWLSVGSVIAIIILLLKSS